MDPALVTTKIQPPPPAADGRLRFHYVIASDEAIAVTVRAYATDGRYFTIAGATYELRAPGDPTVLATGDATVNDFCLTYAAGPGLAVGIYDVSFVLDTDAIVTPGPPVRLLVFPAPGT